MPDLLLRHDHERLVDVLVYHWRRADSGCGCGWHELGRSWPEHVATIYEDCLRAYGSLVTDNERPVAHQIESYVEDE